MDSIGLLAGWQASVPELLPESASDVARSGAVGMPVEAAALPSRRLVFLWYLGAILVL